MFILVNDHDFELVGVGRGRVHGLAEDLRGEDQRLLEGAVLLVVALQRRDRVDRALASGVRLPGAVVARGVRAVQLETYQVILARVHDAEGPRGTELGLHVLVVA